jgi:hypothetical protein
MPGVRIENDAAATRFALQGARSGERDNADNSRAPTDQGSVYFVRLSRSPIVFVTGRTEHELSVSDRIATA